MSSVVEGKWWEECNPLNRWIYVSREGNAHIVLGRQHLAVLCWLNPGDLLGDLPCDNALFKSLVSTFQHNGTEKQYKRPRTVLWLFHLLKGSIFNSYFLSYKLNHAGFHLRLETINMERHEYAAQGKSQIATDSLQWVNLTRSFPTEGRESSQGAGKKLSDHFFKKMKNLG